jgi:serine/threonine protein kinase
LLDYTGHIALCDFGLCKLNMTEESTTNSACFPRSNPSTSFGNVMLITS